MSDNFMVGVCEGLVVGFLIGISIGSILVKKAYEPFIRELKESIEYWYNYSRRNK